MFADADERGTEDDERHAAPAQRVHALVQDELRGERGHDEAHRRQRPDKAHIALAKEILQQDEEDRLQQESEQDVSVRETSC